MLPSQSPRASLQLVDSLLLSQHLAHGETDPARIVSLLRRSPSIFDHSLAPLTSTAQHVVATTHDVLYLDERMPSRTLLRWKHGRCGLESKGVDLTLSLLEVPPHACDAPQRDSAEPVVGRAALTSRLHPHVELYTTRANPAHAPQFALGPYALEGPRLRSSSSSTAAAARPERFARAGTAFVPLPPRATAPSSSSRDAMDVDGASRSSSDEGDDGPAARRERLAEARRAARSRSWRLLEAGARGELSVREVELERYAGPSSGEEGEDEQSVGGAVSGPGAAGPARVELSAELVQLGAAAERARRRTSSRDRRRQKEDERLVDVSKVRRVLAPERVLRASREADELADGAGSADAAVRMVRGAAAREEGDVGALTGCVHNPLSPALLRPDIDAALPQARAPLALVSTLERHGRRRRPCAITPAADDGVRHGRLDPARADRRSRRRARRRACRPSPSTRSASYALLNPPSPPSSALRQRSDRVGGRTTARSRRRASRAPPQSRLARRPAARDRAR